MIRTFKSAALKRYWNEASSKGLPAKDLKRIKRILTALGAATAANDLDLHGYKFHELKGNRKGTYSVTVRANWCITFKWENDAATQVDLEDYHGD
jgi:toxin HigB-1